MAAPSNFQAETITTITSESGRSPAPSALHSATLPTQSRQSRTKPVPGLQHGWTMAGKLGVEQTSTRSTSRSVSPGTRIKDAFKISSRRSSPSKEGSDNLERSGRPDTRDGERPQSQPIHSRPMTGGSTASLPMSTTSNGTDTSIPPVPPLPSSSTPQIAINGTGLGSKPSLSSIVINSGMPGKTPATTITPPTPVVDMDENAPRTPPSKQSPRMASSSPSPGASAHRRTRSDGSTKPPSKLSQSMNAPMTPMEEEPLGGRVRNTSGSTTGSAGGGFFSSMFSAAQNMTTSLTSIGGNPNRPRTGTNGSTPASIPEEKEEAEAQATHEGETGKSDEAAEEPKQLAIDTIGTGNLSLSHLGIVTDSPQALTSPQSAGLRSRSGTLVRHEEAAAKAEDESAARAISAAYQNAPNLLDRPATAIAEDADSELIKPNSTYEGSINARTPPNGSIYEDEAGGNSMARTESLREKIANRRNRRHRNSSTTTIGAAIAASHGTIASPGRNSISQKLEGFTYANKKRDKEYRQLFRSVPEDDHLLDDYSCALQRDIILAGRIYVSEGHICFSSNILGWVTNLVISFDEIVAVDKESTAMVFPNAIAIQTLHARHTFRSLLSREATYELIISIWKTNHPNLQSNETGTKLLSAADAEAAAAAAAAAKNDEEAGSREESDSDSEDGTGDEDGDEGTNDASSMKSRSVSIAGSDLPAAVQTSPVRKASAKVQDPGAVTAPAPTAAAVTTPAVAGAAAAATEKDFPGPATHAPTECTDSATHYENLLKDDVVPAPLGKVYSLLFGPSSNDFMSRWLQDEAKCWDIEVKDGTPLKALDDGNKQRVFTYIKPLNAPIGPKQTKCVVTEQLDAFDLDRSVTVTCTTQTPDVPSGGVFSTKTRYCLSWAPNNGTRLHMSFVIEWTGKSWIKGPIEKGAKDGQTTYADDLIRSLRAGVTAGARGRAGSKSKKSKKSRKGGDGARTGSDGGPHGGAKGGKKVEEPNWGLLEPLRPIFGPVVEPISPLFSARMVASFLAFMLIVSWFRNSPLRASTREANAAAGAGAGPLSHLRAGGHHGFEQVWRTEEDALWTWLEQRVGLQDGVPGGVGGRKAGEEKTNADASKQARKDRQKVLSGRTQQQHASGDFAGMSRREIEYALEVTQEKLDALRRAASGQEHVEKAV